MRILSGCDEFIKVGEYKMDHFRMRESFKIRGISMK
jgi:hypothetical protein